MNNRVFVVAFDARIMSVGPSAVKIVTVCQVINIVDNGQLIIILILLILHLSVSPGGHGKPFDPS